MLNHVIMYPTSHISEGASLPCSLRLSHSASQGQNQAATFVWVTSPQRPLTGHTGLLLTNVITILLLSIAWRPDERRANAPERHQLVRVR